jgi:zeaxanthin glucosyltransferase
MAKLAFFVLPNVGSLHATLKIASDLRARGHDVQYLGLADSAAPIEAHGFSFTTVFERHFPLGYYEAQQRAHSSAHGLAQLAQGRRVARHFHSFFAALLGTEGDALVGIFRELALDLLVLASGDHYVQWPAMFAHMIGLQAVYFHDQLWPLESSGLPPIWSDELTGTSVAAGLRTSLVWQGSKLRYRATQLACQLVGLDLQEDDFLEALAQRCNYFLPARRTFARQAPTLVELVPVPAAFDLPGDPVPGRYHVEAGIYLQRAACTFPFERLRSGRPLVYVALGTVAFFSAERYCAFFQQVVQAALRRPDLDWVVSVGKIVDPNRLGRLPGHCLVVREAPQLQLLQRAAVMVNHGGCNTVKECIYFGVPMVVVPLGAGTDQPGNAARVVHHSLGVRESFRGMTASKLLRAVERVRASEPIASATRRMQMEFQRAELASPGADLLEALMPAACCD